MKGLYHALIVFCIALFTFNCQKEVSYNGPGNPGNGNNNTDPITATLQGNIVDENDQPAIGVLIKVGNKTATTNARGYFRISNAALDKSSSLVTAEKTGYFKAYRVFGASSGVNQVAIKLLKRSTTGSINVSSGGDVTLANGTKITFPANGIVKASGGAYSGSMKVYATYIDPTDPDISQNIPGSFQALDKDNKKVILTSYGMVAVELESSAGEKLQVAPNSTATLTMPIPAALQSSAPASIALWFVDEQTGIWKEEGTATKTGNSYIGTVKHFTYWNCDVAGPRVNLTAIFKTPEGVPVTATDVWIRPATGYSAAHGFTDSLGQINGPIPANIPLVLEVMSPCNSVMYSQNIGPYSSDVNLGTITVNPNPSTVVVKGRLVNCSGAAVTNGYVNINYGNWVRYVSVSNTGEFASTFYTCAGMPSTCQIYGVDITAQQQGATVNVSVVSPLTDAGDITACGTSSIQYINYNVDGTNYSVSSLVQGDEFTGIRMDSVASDAAYLSGRHGNNSAITFIFGHTGVPGTYPLTTLSVGNNNQLIVSPSTVVLTNCPQTVGQFYEGTFSGQYEDNAGVTHVISCSFRVRRNA
jgi:hypothetical protein